MNQYKSGEVYSLKPRKDISILTRMRVDRVAGGYVYYDYLDTKYASQKKRRRMLIEQMSPNWVLIIGVDDATD